MVFNVLKLYGKIIGLTGENGENLNFLFEGNTQLNGLSRNATTSEDDTALLNAIFAYARENIALVNIYIKPPVVTRILRDQRTPIIWYGVSSKDNKI